MKARFLDIVAVATLTVFGAACSDQPTASISPAAGKGAFAAPCQDASECASGLCVRVGNAPPLCSKPCTNDSACPEAANWRCVRPGQRSSQVCACHATATTEVCGDGADNDCDGRVDDCLMCNGKPVEPDDPKHCGGCNHACAADRVCQGGVCKCPTVTIDCSGVCVDTKTSAQHCGACGKQCQQGEVCQGGACACTSPPAPDSCPGAGCVDMSTDAKNCGFCGNACPSGQECVAGKCACPDVALPDYCPGEGCVSLYSDAENCGSCGNPCTGGKTCKGGACTCPDNAPVDCGAVCAAIKFDDANCGACGNACPEDQHCNYGKCACDDSSLQVCDGQCLDLAFDESHCGDCGKACVPGETCNSYKCYCASNLHCGGVCVPLNDEANCGACGNVCPWTQLCQVGKCVCSTPGQSPCGDKCVALQTDLMNCGMCDHACENGESCQSGVCSCPGGQTWCAETGNCTDLKTSNDHCGSCQTACQPGQSCTNGLCKCPVAGQTWCAQAQGCVDLKNNAAHCGACGIACPSGTACSAGVCKCTQAGLSLCGDTCVDLKSDEAHCGACDKPCSGAMQCSSGACRCAPPVLGPPVRITTTPETTYLFGAAWDGAHVGVVYWNQRSTNNTGNAYFTLLNPDGTRAIATDVPVAEYPAAAPANWGVRWGGPALVWTGSEYGLAWTEFTAESGSPVYRLMFRRLAPDGTPLGQVVNISATTPNGAAAYASNRPRLAFVAGQGYAVFTLGEAESASMLNFQRIGIDGTSPEQRVVILPPNGGAHGLWDYNALAGSPGGWGALYLRDNTDLMFVRPNLDGSITQPTDELFTDGGSGWFPHLRWDGASWLASWLLNKSPSTASVVIGRGPKLETRVVVETLPHGSPAIYRPVDMPWLDAMGSDLVFTWARRTSGYENAVLVGQRFMLPPGPTDAPVPVTDPFMLVDTKSVGSTQLVVHISGKDFVQLWTDLRWGYGEVYALRGTSPSCP